MLARRVLRSIIAIALVSAALLPLAARAADEEAAQTLRIGFLSEALKRLPPQPYLDAPPADEGVAGARLAIADDNTTGRFTNQHFALEEMIVPEGGDVAAGFGKLVGEGIRLVATDLAAGPLLAVADLPAAKGVTLFNAGAPDDDLRAGKCRANVLHTLPSRAMLADALVEYLLVKQWRNIFLVTGPTEADRAYAAAVRHAIEKYQARLVADKPWTYQPGARRSDTGHYAIGAEVAHFTQGISYDVLVVADEDDEFGDYLAYATYDPRPIAGTHGPRPFRLGAAASGMGRNPAPGPLPAAGEALDDVARLRRLARGARRGRGGDTGTIARSRRNRDISAQRQIRARWLQGRAAELPSLGRADAPGDRACRCVGLGLGLAAARIPAPVLAPRHAGHRSSGEPMPFPLTCLRALCRLLPLAVLAALASGAARASTVLVSNEKGNSITVLDGATLKLIKTVPVGQRPRGIVLSQGQAHALYLRQRR